MKRHTDYILFLALHGGQSVAACPTMSISLVLVVGTFVAVTDVAREMAAMETLRSQGTHGCF